MMPALPPAKQNKILVLITLFVALCHLLLFTVDSEWKKTTPVKKRSKVLVQTIQLTPSLIPSPAQKIEYESAALQESEKTKEKQAAPSTEKSPSPKLEEKELEKPKKENKAPAPKSPPKKEEPPPAKKEAPKKSETQKEPAKAATATDIKKTPAAKPEAKKEEKKVPTKELQNKAEAEKKKEIEKKKEAEKQEAEKKRQTEVAAAEKKKQEEIKKATEAARQKIAKAKESLAKMSETRDKIQAKPLSRTDLPALPQEIRELQIETVAFQEPGKESSFGVKEISYSEEIAYRLKMNLKLPDYGAVTIKLTLNREGRFVRMEVVKSASKKNKEYVEKKISTLFFPSFGQNFPGISEQSFTFTLQNK